MLLAAQTSTVRAGTHPPTRFTPLPSFSYTHTLATSRAFWVGGWLPRHLEQKEQLSWSNQEQGKKDGRAKLAWMGRNEKKTKTNFSRTSKPQKGKWSLYLLLLVMQQKNRRTEEQKNRRKEEEQKNRRTPLEGNEAQTPHDDRETNASQ